MANTCSAEKSTKRDKTKEEGRKEKENSRQKRKRKENSDQITNPALHENSSQQQQNAGSVQQQQQQQHFANTQTDRHTCKEEEKEKMVLSMYVVTFKQWQHAATG